MGIFSWMRKGAGGQGTRLTQSQQSRTPTFEQLEPRVLLNVDALMPPELLPIETPFEAAIVVDLEETNSALSSQLSAVSESDGQCDGETVGQSDSGTVDPLNGREVIPSSSHPVTQSHGLSVSRLTTVSNLISIQNTQAKMLVERTTSSSDSTVILSDSQTVSLLDTALGCIEIRGPPAEIVFIDSSLNLDCQLENAVQTSVLVSVFDTEQNGIQQITDTLSGYTNLTAIHIISHGAPGRVFLGEDVLDSETLEDYADSLAAWGDSLTSEGDILLYGCSIGAGQSGSTFVEQLAVITEADVAASNNPTGNIEYGGDWVLEFSVGTVGSCMPFDIGALAGLASVLDDFGDAPATYPTTLAENGAVHLDAGPTLGGNRDNESDGSHSSLADADDTTGIDDEDGVTFSTIQVGQVDCSVIVNVQGGSGKLDAWIDFNGDGSWGGVGERVFASQDVVVGDNSLTFDVPSWAIPGETYARFRLSTGGQLAPGGSGSDGEVEDYQVTIMSASGSGAFVDSGNSLGSSDSWSISLGDVDDDGDLDAFVANHSDGVNKVWLNDGSGVFTNSGHSLGSSLSYGVSLGDLDGDGDLDAFVANYGEANRVWLNNGLGVFEDSGYSLGNSGSFDVSLGDLDGDGDLDAFVANAYTQANRVWLNNGFGVFEDSGQSLGSSSSFDVSLGDLDGDGDLDAYVANHGEANRLWLNNGSGVFEDSGQSLGSSNSAGVSFGDVDSDGDLDAFVANASNQGNKVWLNDGSGTLTDSGQSLGSSHSAGVSLGDLNGDGVLDALVANAINQANKVWFNNGSGVFVNSNNSLGSSQSVAVSLGDLDGDGTLDAFAANYGGQPNKVWLNQVQSMPGQPPTDISLDSTSVNENEPVNTVVGTFSTTDPDLGDTHTYSLVSGVGDAENGSFTISNNQLLTAEEFDYESKHEYSICVRSTDDHGWYYDEAFTIAVTDQVYGVSGHIIADTVWDDTSEPYVLNGNLYVDPGATLTLASDVTLRTTNYNYDIYVDGRLACTNAALELLYYYSPYGRRTELLVRDGGDLALTGSTVRGPGQIIAQDGAQADFTNVSFEYYSGGSDRTGSPQVTYDTGSSGSVDNGHGQWSLSVGSGALVSIVNGIEITNLSIAEPMTVDAGAIDVLSVSTNATITNSEIGYVNLNGGTPTLTGNTLTDASPLRTADPDNLNTSLITGNTFSAADPVIYVRGTLDSDEIFEAVDDQVSVYLLSDDLIVSSGATLTLPSDVTLRTTNYNYDIYVDGRLACTNAALELLYYYSPYGRRTELLVRDGGDLALTGSTVRGPGQIIAQDGAQADFTNVSFEYYSGGSDRTGSPQVTYDTGSSGSVDNGHGQWSLSVGSGALVSIVNGIEITNLSIAEPMTVDAGAIDVLSVSTNASITNSEIGYVNLNGGTPTLTGNRLTDGIPLRTTDPDNLNTSLITGNTFSATDPVIYVMGTLDSDEVFEAVDGQVSVYLLSDDLIVSSDATLTLPSGVTLRTIDYNYDIFVDGRLECAAASIELLYHYSSAGRRTELFARDGGELSLSGSTVGGPGEIIAQDGAQADFINVAFEYYSGGSYTTGSPQITYQTGSSGAMRRCSGQSHSAHHVQGQHGNAIDFDGADDYVDLGDPGGSLFDLGEDATIETWVKFDSLPNGSFSTIAGKDEGGGGRPKWIFAYANDYAGISNATVFHIYGAYGSAWLTSEAWTPELGRWYHLALVKSGNAYSFYRDGQIHGTDSTTVSVPDVNYSLLLGQAEGQFRLDGQLDDLRMWKLSRSGADIAADLDHELEGNESGLEGYWRFNEGAGLTMFDSTTNANHGLFHGLANATDWTVHIHEQADVVATNNDFSLATIIASGDSSGRTDLTGNWWGTVDPAEIEDRIVHQADESTRPLALYDPWLITNTLTDLVPPTLLSWDLIEDTGLDQTDRVTNDTTLELRLIFSEPVVGEDSDILVLGPSGIAVELESITGWETTDPLIVLFNTALTEQGQYTVTLQGDSTITDGGGNPLNAGEDEVLHFILDTTPPIALPPSGIADDAGTPEDDLTSDNTLFIQGSAEADSIVQVFIDGILSGTTLADSEGNWIYDNTHQTLANGTHAASIIVTDAAGNTSEASSDLVFTVQGAAVHWDGGGDGTSWSDPLNWDTDFLPVEHDDVIINVADDPTITIDVSAGPVELRSIETHEQIILSGGSLSTTVAITLIDKDFTLAGGTLIGSHVTSNGIGKLIISSSSTLDGVVLDADGTVQNGRTLTVLNGLELNGGLTLQHTGSYNTTSVDFPGIQELSGIGEVVSIATEYRRTTEAGNYLRPTDSGVLTIGSGITIHGDEMIVGDAALELINRGTIRSDGTGSYSTIHIGGSTWTNTGSFQAFDDGRLRFFGTLDNTSQTQTFDTENFTELELDGVIQGGTLASSASTALLISNSSGGILDGVALETNVTLEDDTSLTILNGLVLNSRLTLRHTGSYNTTSVNFPGIQELSGTGEVVSIATEYRRTAEAGNYLRPTDGGVLTIGSGITIHGDEMIVGDAALELINRGTIRSDGTGSYKKITITGNNWTNEGLISAANGAILDLAGAMPSWGPGSHNGLDGQVRIVGVLNNAGEVVHLDAASAGALHLAGGTIIGGTIAGNAELIVSGSGTLNGVVLDADGAVQDKQTLTILNGLELNGRLTLQHTGSYNTTSVIFPGIQELSGTGEVVSVATEYRRTAEAGNYLRPTDSGVLTIGSGITISGDEMSVGDANLGLINRGTIRSDGTGSYNRVTVIGQGWTNEGLLAVANGATLDLAGTMASWGPGSHNGLDGQVRVVGVLSNAGETVNLDAVTTGPLHLAGGTVTGGTIAGDSELIVSGGSTLNGVVLDVSGSIESRDTLNVVNNLELNGTLTLETGGWSYGPIYTSLHFSGEQSLNGAGELILSDYTRVRSTDSGTLTIGPDITIHTGSGSGRVGAIGESLVNQGTILSDGQTLTVTGTDWSNQGTLQAINDGILKLEGTIPVGGLGSFDSLGGKIQLAGTLDNTGATIDITTFSGPLYLSGGTVVGGTLAGDGQLLVSGSGTLNGVILDASGSIESRGTLNVVNNLELNGTLTLETGGWSYGPIYTSLHFSGEQSLNGAGELILSDYTRVRSTDSGTLTIGPDITIHTGSGSGRVGAIGESLVNQGTILSDGQTLTVTGTDWSNQGTLQAINDGILKLEGTIPVGGLGSFDSLGGKIQLAGTLDNTGATIDITTLSGPLHLCGGMVVGGTLAGDGQLLVSGTGTLDGMILDVSGSIETTGTLNVVNNLELNNTLTLETGGWSYGPIYTSLYFSGEQSVSGLGEVILSDYTRVQSTDSGTLTIGPDITMRTGTGSGRLGAVGERLVNQGTILAETPGQTINIHGTDWLSEGVIRSLGGTISLNDTWTNSGLIDASVGNISGGNGENQGTIIVGPDRTFSVSGDYIQTNGTTTVEGGTLDPSGDVELLGGVLEGNGIILSNVSNSAMVSPGTSAGRLTIQGDYTQTVEGVLDVEIAGLLAGHDFDVLIVSGTATLDGTLELTLLDGFSPAPDDDFKVVSSGARLGSFVDISRQDAYLAFGFTPNYEPDGFSLTVFTDDSAGPTVVEHQVDELVSSRTSLTQFEITFNEMIDFNPDGTGSFWLDDIQISGPTAKQATDIEHLGGTRFLVTIEPLDVAGSYTISVGPEISDIVGNPMDWDNDCENGESPDDIYAFFVLAIDFDRIITEPVTIAANDPTFDGLDLYIGDTTVTIDGFHIFSSIYLAAGGTITHSPDPDGQLGSLLDITVAGNLTVEAGSQITADGLGYGKGSGPEPGRNDPRYNVHGSGAGHGGVGGECTPAAIGGGVYGSVTEPHELGSGGGGTSGGAGGGVLHITVTGILELNGDVTADGSAGGSRGGGGAGGSIKIHAGVMTGTGTLSAEGGDAGDSYGGGGGGGRIVVYCPDILGLAENNIIVTGGWGHEYGGDGTVYRTLASDASPRVIEHQVEELFSSRTSPLTQFEVTFSELIDFQPSGTGSFWLDDIQISGPASKQAIDIQELGGNSFLVALEPFDVAGTYTIHIGPEIADMAGHLMDGDVDGVYGEIPDDIYTFSVSAVDFDRIITEPLTIAANDPILDELNLYIRDTIVTVDGAHTFNSIHIEEGGTLTHSPDPDGQLGNRLDLTITGDLTVDAGGRISVDGQGYGARSGPEAGQNDPYHNVHGSGGGHGGVGGECTPTASGGGVYGSVTEPDEFGSGGGNNTNGGAGGGVVDITVVGTFELNGEVSADGADGGSRGGGGAGGSIQIHAGGIAGTGTISADGGDAGDSYGGGGGGGRIAVYYADISGFTESNVSAAGGWGHEYGGAGTIYIKSSDQDHGELQIDNNNYLAESTRLPEDSYTFDAVDIRNQGILEIPADANLVLASGILTVGDDGHIVVDGQMFSGVEGNTAFTAMVVSTGGKLTLGTQNQIQATQLQVLSNGQLTLEGDSLVACEVLELSGGALILNDGSHLATTSDAIDVGGSLTLNGNSDFSAQQVEILSGGILALNDPRTLTRIHIASGGTLTHSADPDGQLGNRLDLTIIGDLTVDAGGRISVDGQGYGTRSGPEPGQNDPHYNVHGSGGGHGGVGGECTPTASGGGVYGSVTEPDEFGSGGGNNTNGGAGGGVVDITVVGTFELNGEVSADGADGGSRGGGGAGGSIQIHAGVITGTGMISADGGDAGDSYGGGGGGGRIAIYYADVSGFTESNVSAAGGWGHEYGGAGTIYLYPMQPLHLLSHSPDVPGNLPVQNIDVLFDKAIDPVTFSVEDVELYAPNGSPITVSIGSESVDTEGKIWRISFPVQSAHGEYQLLVGPHISGISGHEMDNNLNGIEAEEPEDAYVRSFIIDTMPPEVSSHLPVGDVCQPANHIELSFSEEIDPGTFGVEDVTVNGPSGSIIVDSLVPGVGNTWLVAFAEQVIEGLYTISVGPDILDVVGNAMGAIYAGDFTISLPDLMVANITVDPEDPETASEITIGWQVHNTGSGTVDDTFVDRVQVVNTSIAETVFDGVVMHDPSAAAHPSIGSGQWCEHQVTFDLPNGTAGIGDYTITVTTDNDSQITEYNDTGSAESNNANTGSFSASTQPYADLTIAPVNPPTQVTMGQQARLE